jgi:hypothetical protein
MTHTATGPTSRVICIRTSTAFPYSARAKGSIFLWERQGEPCRVLGWAQGTFRIARNADTGVETVTQDSAMAPIFDPRTRAFRGAGIRNLPVGIFQLKLRRALEQKD